MNIQYNDAQQYKYFYRGSQGGNTLHKILYSMTYAMVDLLKVTKL